MTYSYATIFRDWGAEELAAIQRVIASDRYTYGAEVEALEHELAAYHGRAHCVAVNSGSSANWVAMFALEKLFGTGSVSLPAVAWATTWSPFISRDFKILLRDIDNTWNAPLDYDSRHADGIVTCPILGNPAYIAEIWDMICGQSNRWVLEDACESVGSVTADGRRVGTLGTISTVSFYMSHQIAGIEGGAILTDDPELDRLCRVISSHGWTRDVESPASFEDEYKFLDVPAMNVRATEINAAVQRVQLARLEETNAVRRANADHFRAATAGLPLRLPRFEGSGAPFGLAFEVDPAQRTALAQALRGAGVDCRLPTGGCLTCHPMGAAYRHQSVPRAERLHAGGMFIGNASRPIPDLIDRAVAVMREVL